MKIDEVPDKSDMMPFLEEAAVMMVYDRLTPPRRHHVSNLRPGSSTRCSRGYKDTRM
jgi:hypothetical protein